MKLQTIAEAKYTLGEEKGSLRWLLKNFFDEYQHQEMENSNGDAVEAVGYRVKNGFEITTRGVPLASLTVYSNGETQTYVKRSFASSPSETHAIPERDFVIKMVKTVWPQSP